MTGDDFGFSRGVNRAIVEALERGVLTSASLMVTGDAFAEAVALARARPRLAVGLHLVVVAGRSALPPAEIPHIVDATGRSFSSPTRAGLRYQIIPAARAELRREIRAQLELFRRTGLPLAHVDGHLHMHLHPIVLRELAELAPEFQIPVVRLPSEELGLALSLGRVPLATRLVWSAVFPLLRRNGILRLRRAGVAYADRVYGLLATGRLSEQYLVDLLPKIVSGVGRGLLPSVDRNGRGVGQRRPRLWRPRARGARESPSPRGYPGRELSADELGRSGPGRTGGSAGVTHAIALPHFALLLARALAATVCATATGYSAFAIYCARDFFSTSRRPAPPFTPPISILKPVCGLDRESYANFASFCRQTYPTIQILFGAERSDDPGLTVARQIARDFPDLDILVVATPNTRTSNPKVGILAALARNARHPYLLVSDSDIRVGPCTWPPSPNPWRTRVWVS